MIHNLPQSLIEAALQVLESTLLEDRIDFLKDKNQEIDTSHDALAQHRASGDIIDHLATHADPTKKKTYTQWILGQYKAKNIRQEDAGRVHSVLTNFEKYKSRLANKDINQYDTINSVSQAVHPHLGLPTTRKEETAHSIHAGRTLVHDNGQGLKVFRLEPTEDGKKASQEIYGGGHELGGTHTSWCTAARSEDCMFDKYSKKSPLYTIHTPTGNVYQAHPETKQLMDAKDEDIEPSSKDVTHVAKALDHVPDGWKLKIFRKVGEVSDDELNAGLGDMDENMRMAAAMHPNATSKHIFRALNDYDPDVRRVAMKNINITKEHIDTALDDRKYSVREAAAAHKNATKEHLDKALTDKNVFVRMAVAENQNATKEHLGRALNDFDVDVVRGAKLNPKAKKYGLV